MALAPNAAYGLLNPGTTTPTGPPPTIGGVPYHPIYNPPGGYVPGVSPSAPPSNTNPYPGSVQPPQPSGPAAQAPALAQAVPQAQPSSPFSAINSFPGVSNALALEQQGYGQLDAQLNALRQRAIINYGDPNLASLAGFGIDPQAGAFAQQNYLAGSSTKARTDRQHQLNAQAVINALAAHGILQSGDLGYLEGQENQNYGNVTYDQQQSVLGQLTDAYNNYLAQRQGLHQGTISAQLQALQEYLSNPDAYSTLAGLSNASAPSAAPSVTPPALPRATPPKSTGKTTKSTPATRALIGIGGHI